MKLSKKDLKRIEKSAIKYKQFYETPNHEIDAIVQDEGRRNILHIGWR